MRAEAPERRRGLRSPVAPGDSRPHRAPNLSSRHADVADRSPTNYTGLRGLAPLPVAMVARALISGRRVALLPESCLSEHPPQIDECPFLDVLAVRRPQHPGLRAERDALEPE